ncbi:MAG: hypothetical protein ABMA26_03090 [Limisphaerales bacterium]
MNEPSKHIHWVTRQLLGSRASQFKTVADYSKAELEMFQAEYQRRVLEYHHHIERRVATSAHLATRVLAFLVGSLGIVLLFLFMFTPLFVPFVTTDRFGAWTFGLTLLSFVTPFVGWMLFGYLSPRHPACPSCAVPVGFILASFCPVCGKRSLKEPAKRDYERCNASQCPDCGSSLHMTNQEGRRSFRNCYCTHCGIPLATADGQNFVGPKMLKCISSWGNASLGFACVVYLCLSGVLRLTELPQPYPIVLGLVGAVVYYVYMKQRSAKPKPPA